MFICMTYFVPSYILLQEKVDALEVLGADVRQVPAVPFDNPKNYNHQVRQIVKEMCDDVE